MRRKFAVPADAYSSALAEARRQLLRDLHDGVGPSLAAVALGLRTARHLVQQDPLSARRLLARLEDEMHSAIDDIRRLAANECPSALAQLGFVGAVHQYAEALASRQRTRVEVTVRGEIPDLPEAVTIAAYRIVCEALSNVAAHADARVCVVHLWFDRDLHVEVVDDGVGTSTIGSDGVGLHSMRERARELGGTWVIEPGSSGGTRIAAELPVVGGM